MRLQVGLCPALTEEVLDKLKRSRIRNIVDFMRADPEDIAIKSSISYSDLRSIRKVIMAHGAAFVVQGDDLLKEAILTTRIIPTGNTKLDQLLGGGLLTGEVVEVCGVWGSGKTSLCVSVAIHAALHLGLSVLYMDPLAAVSSLRFQPHVERLDTDLKGVEAALSRINVASPNNAWELLEALNLAHAEVYSSSPVNSGGSMGSLGSHDDKYKLVIVDSLPSLVTPLRGPSRQEFGLLNQVAAGLRRVGSEQGAACVVVNNVVDCGHKTRTGATNNQKTGEINQTGENNQKTVENSQKRPALGKFWESVPHTRLLLERLSNHPMENNEDALAVNVSVWKSSRLKKAHSQIYIIPNSPT